MAPRLAPTFEEDRWVPPPERIPQYRVHQFLTAHGLADYRALAERASAAPEWFYPAAIEFLDLPWMSPPDVVLDERDGRPFAHWFAGARTNLAWLATRVAATDPERLAVIAEDDDGATTSVTYGELADRVARVAAGFRRLGVTHGDVVTMHLPMVPEAVVCMLAAARIGAIVAPAFSGYGVDALRERLEIAGTKVIVTADGTRRRGRELRLAPTALAAAEGLAHVEHCVVVSHLGAELPAHPLVTPWADVLGAEPDGPAEALDVETPWLLAFTSGSTGRPKGAVHTHGGMVYGAATEFAFGFDLGPGDRLCWPSDMGWLVGPIGASMTLVLGGTFVLFDGVMDWPQPDRLWRVAERHRLTHLGLSPTVARVLAAEGDDWVDGIDLPELRIIGSTGEPWTPAAWRWLHRHVGRGVAPIINWAGGTEVGGGILCSSPVEPTRECRFSGPTLGMAADVVDQDGRSLIEEMGELVVRKSWPSMTRGFWQERERYLTAYWERIPGMWVHGDRAIRHADGSWDLPGRSDDVMKIAGKRLGPSELESLALDIDGVALAGAVGYPHPIKGEVPVIALTVTPEADAAKLTDLVADRIEAALGKPFRPHAVVVVSELPITRSGKIHRRALRNWLAGEPPGDLSSVDNISCGEEIRAVGVELGATPYGTGGSR